MRRREFLSLVSAATGWPFSAYAQKPGKAYRIAMVHSNRPTAEMAENSPVRGYQTFFRELRRLGYVEGENLTVERYSGGGKAATYRELADGIARTNPDLIFAAGGMARYLKDVTSKIPIVTFVPGDAARMGIVTSLARPGGNVTGVGVDAGSEIWGKRFELLQQAVPAMSKVGFLATRQDSRSAEKVREVIRKAGVTIVSPSFDSSMKETEYKRVFAVMLEQGAEAVLVSDDGDNNTNILLIVEQIAEAGLPAMYPIREATEAGGLMAYAIDFNELFRLMASQIDQIFKGRNPAEIPIYLPTKYELIINLKAAKTLRLTVPASLLIGADEVIE
jgi:putative ABC transport system substrate-binding protein